MARVRRTHPKAVYTTATVPLPMIRELQLRYLQGESIHDLLGLIVVHDRPAAGQQVSEALGNQVVRRV